MNQDVMQLIENADAIVIGAGAGLSTAAGLNYAGERFEHNFPEFIAEYRMTDMYSAMFYPYNSSEEKWAYWSKHVYLNRYEFGASQLYKALFKLVKDKEYFVLTTNVDHQFYLAGFDEKRVFPTQGDYGLFQCSKPCHDKLYSNEKLIKLMVDKQKDLKIPTDLIPKCPKCGEEMSLNLRKDDTFVEDRKWDLDNSNYQSFIQNNQKKKIVFIELGVGMNTPGIIKYPFWQLVNQFKDSYYVCMNKGEAWAPMDIKDRSICLNTDIYKEFMN